MSNPYIDSAGCTVQGSCPLRFSIHQNSSAIRGISGNASSGRQVHDPNSVLIVADCRVHSPHFFQELELHISRHHKVYIHWIGGNDQINPNKEIDLLLKAFLEEWATFGTITSYKAVIWCAIYDDTARAYGNSLVTTEPTKGAFWLAKGERERYLRKKQLDLLCNHMPVIFLDDVSGMQLESALASINSLTLRIDELFYLVIGSIQSERRHEHARYHSAGADDFVDAPDVRIDGELATDGSKLRGDHQKSLGQNRSSPPPMKCFTLVTDKTSCPTAQIAADLLRNEHRHIATRIYITADFDTLTDEQKRNPILVIAMNRDSHNVTKMIRHNEPGNNVIKNDMINKYAALWNPPDETHAYLHPCSYSDGRARLQKANAMWAKYVKLHPKRNSRARLVLLEWNDTVDGSFHAWQREQPRLDLNLIQVGVFDQAPFPGPAMAPNMLTLSSIIIGLVANASVLHRDKNGIYTVLTKDDWSKSLEMGIGIPPRQLSTGKMCSLVCGTIAVIAAVGEAGATVIEGTEVVSLLGEGVEAGEAFEGASGFAGAMAMEAPTGAVMAYSGAGVAMTAMPTMTAAEFAGGTAFSAIARGGAYYILRGGVLTFAGIVVAGGVVWATSDNDAPITEDVPDPRHPGATHTVTIAQAHQLYLQGDQSPQMKAWVQAHADGHKVANISDWYMTTLDGESAAKRGEWALSLYFTGGAAAGADALHPYYMGHPGAAAHVHHATAYQLLHHSGEISWMNAKGKTFTGYTISGFSASHKPSTQVMTWTGTFNLILVGDLDAGTWTDSAVDITIRVLGSDGQPNRGVILTGHSGDVYIDNGIQQVTWHVKTTDPSLSSTITEYVQVFFAGNGDGSDFYFEIDFGTTKDPRFSGVTTRIGGYSDYLINNDSLWEIKSQMGWFGANCANLSLPAQVAHCRGNATEGYRDIIANDPQIDLATGQPALVGITQRHEENYITVFHSQQHARLPPHSASNRVANLRYKSDDAMEEKMRNLLGHAFTGTDRTGDITQLLRTHGFRAHTAAARQFGMLLTTARAVHDYLGPTEEVLKSFVIKIVALAEIAAELLDDHVLMAMTGAATLQDAIVAAFHGHDATDDIESGLLGIQGQVWNAAELILTLAVPKINGLLTNTVVALQSVRGSFNAATAGISIAQRATLVSALLAMFQGYGTIFDSATAEYERVYAHQRPMAFADLTHWLSIWTSPPDVANYHTRALHEQSEIQYQVGEYERANLLDPNNRPAGGYTWTTLIHALGSSKPAQRQWMEYQTQRVSNGCFPVNNRLITFLGSGPGHMWKYTTKHLALCTTAVGLPLLIATATASWEAADMNGMVAGGQTWEGIWSRSHMDKKQAAIDMNLSASALSRADAVYEATITSPSQRGMDEAMLVQAAHASWEIQATKMHTFIKKARQNSFFPTSTAVGGTPIKWSNYTLPADHGTVFGKNRSSFYMPSDLYGEFYEHIMSPLFAMRIDHHWQSYLGAMLPHPHKLTNSETGSGEETDIEWLTRMWASLLITLQRAEHETATEPGHTRPERRIMIPRPDHGGMYQGIPENQEYYVHANMGPMGIAGEGLWTKQIFYSNFPAIRQQAKWLAPTPAEEEEIASWGNESVTLRGNASISTVTSKGRRLQKGVTLSSQAETFLRQYQTRESISTGVQIGKVFDHIALFIFGKHGPRGGLSPDRMTIREGPLIGEHLDSMHTHNGQTVIETATNLGYIYTLEPGSWMRTLTDLLVTPPENKWDSAASQGITKGLQSNPHIVSLCVGDIPTKMTLDTPGATEPTHNAESINLTPSITFIAHCFGQSGTVHNPPNWIVGQKVAIVFKSNANNSTDLCGLPVIHNPKHRNWNGISPWVGDHYNYADVRLTIEYPEGYKFRCIDYICTKEGCPASGGGIEDGTLQYIRKFIFRCTQVPSTKPQIPGINPGAWHLTKELLSVGTSSDHVTHTIDSHGLAQKSYAYISGGANFAKHHQGNKYEGAFVATFQGLTLFRDEADQGGVSIEVQPLQMTFLDVHADTLLSTALLIPRTGPLFRCQFNYLQGPAYKISTFATFITDMFKDTGTYEIHWTLPKSYPLLCPTPGDYEWPINSIMLQSIPLLTVFVGVENVVPVAGYADDAAIMAHATSNNYYVAQGALAALGETYNAGLGTTAFGRLVTDNSLSSINELGNVETIQGLMCVLITGEFVIDSNRPIAILTRMEKDDGSDGNDYDAFTFTEFMATEVIHRQAMVGTDTDLGAPGNPILEYPHTPDLRAHVSGAHGGPLPGGWDVFGRHRTSWDPVLTPGTSTIQGYPVTHISVTINIPSADTQPRNERLWCFGWKNTHWTYPSTGTHATKFVYNAVHLASEAEDATHSFTPKLTSMEDFSNWSGTQVCMGKLQDSDLGLLTKFVPLATSSTPFPVKRSGSQATGNTVPINYTQGTGWQGLACLDGEMIVEP